MPANAVGGSINVISKTGFSRKDPLFSYNIYATYSARRGEFDPTFDKQSGPDGVSTKRPAQFAYELSYLLPLNDKLAFSFGLTHAPRLQEAEFLGPAWGLSAVNPPTVNNQVMSEYMSSQVTDTAKAGVEWKIGKYGKLQASYFQTDRVGLRRYNRLQWVTNAAGRVGDADSTTGRGDARQLQDWQTQNRELKSTSVIYRHEGPVWKADASIAFSKGKYSNDDISEGHFAVLNATAASNSIDWVVSGHQGVQENPGRIPVIEGSYVSNGEPVSVFDGNILGINRVTSNDELEYLNENRSVGLNLGREFDFTIPTSIKVGAYIEESSRDGVTAVKTYNFRPNGSTAFANRLASNFDVLVPQGYTDRQYFTDVAGTHHHTRFISLAKLYDLYLENPSWFVLDEAAAHIAQVNGSQEVTETITALYFRVDNKFMENRLKFTSGVRYEHTEDEGSGPLNDIAATYQRNPDGTFVTTAGGAFVPITTDPLARAQLQYAERGASKTTDYEGFYPSINANYTLGEKFVIRAGIARTIGRPDLSRIIPSTIVSDPDDVDPGSGSLGTIRVVDGSLDPWSANNYDLTLEAYDFKSATASVSLFRKEVKDFFTTREETPTAAMMQELGLPSDLADGYRVVRTVNSGSATIQGVELSYRQSLNFLPGWAKRFHLFANYTNQNITGPNESDFLRVAEKMLRGGISYIHPKFVLKVNLSYEDYLKVGTAAGGAFTFLSPSTRWDFSAQYRFNSRLSAFFSVRNLTSEPQMRSVLNFNTINPEYSHPRDWRYLPATYTFGIKGTF
jgi:TonB-dependent receptor